VLRELDAARIGSSPQHYHELARELEPLGVPVEMSKLFQVDLMKPAADLVIGDAVIAEVLRAVDVVHGFSRPRLENSLDEFRRAFQDRYGADCEVPLLAALDEESGIGFERSASAAAEASPLLSGLTLQRRNAGARLGFGNADATMLELLTRALTNGSIEVSLTDDDIKRMANADRPPMPDAFQAMFTLAAPSSDAIERGDFRLLFHGALGPSGARMLGRFCHIDDAIREGVEAHVRAEEALRLDALFAELVHLPAGRLGNILARPVLREHEIAFLGRSGAPRERQIALDDLMLTVSGDQIRLRSKSLDREVIPRLSSAHNTTGESLGVYRFLAALQRAIAMTWSWGPLDAAPFLPRVVSGRVVLSRARWRINSTEIRPLAAVSGAERDRAVQQFREAHRMPRYVMLTDGDNELLVDFENALVLDSVIDLIRNRGELYLTELYPSQDELCAEGPEGRFFHELIVPFTRKATDVVRPRVERKAPVPLVTRTFPPGSEWLYMKLYTGTSTADRVLLEEIAPLAKDAAVPWFFIRYSDPEWHLRVRFRGQHVRPALEAAAQRLVDAGAVWKVQLDTYEREVERYGGPEAIELAEQIFYRDSEAVVSMLESCSGDAGSDLRWRLMIAGIDRLFADFGLDLAARLRLAEQSRDSFAGQFHFDAVRDRLATRLRPVRASLQDILESHIPALDQRSAAIVPLANDLRRTRLTMPIDAIVSSLAHMFVNRLARSAGPEHELVLYDYLAQLYRSRVARERKGQPRENIAL
jgi:thiopeptide-type bacteriocin biosynthesis protein